MKSLLSYLLALFAVVFTIDAFAQVPTQMQYSLRLSDQTNKEFIVRMELRQGTMDGDVVWFQTIDTKTDDKGTCNMLLDFGNAINWRNSPYYIVALVDDKEIGGSILTSVPYSLCAASLDGYLTREELIGIWKTYYDYDGQSHLNYAITFNEDGTGVRQSGEENPYYYHFSWIYKNGTLWYKEDNDSSYGDLQLVMKKTSTQAYMKSGGAEYYLFNKVAE